MHEICLISSRYRRSRVCGRDPCVSGLAGVSQCVYGLERVSKESVWYEWAFSMCMRPGWRDSCVVLRNLFMPRWQDPPEHQGHLLAKFLPCRVQELVHSRLLALLRTARLVGVCVSVYVASSRRVPRPREDICGAFCLVNHTWPFPKHRRPMKMDSCDAWCCRTNGSG